MELWEDFDDICAAALDDDDLRLSENDRRIPACIINDNISLLPLGDIRAKYLKTLLLEKFGLTWPTRPRFDSLAWPASGPVRGVSRIFSTRVEGMYGRRLWNDGATVGHLIFVWFAVAFVGNFASRHSCGRG